MLVKEYENVLILIFDEVAKLKKLGGFL